MPRYRNEGSQPLNYQDSGGPDFVAPGAEFEHVIPPAQLATHLRMGIVRELPTATVADEVHVHSSREAFKKTRGE